MPRQSRIDAPGAFHHVIGRGINRQKIFLDDDDRRNFLDRLATLLTDSGIRCLAWAMLDNHFHLLLRTGTGSVSTLMRRLLTGYAVSHNRRYNRSGHLFQNRYKSILCQEDPYLLELVRYIHLNPLRAGMVSDMNQLDAYPFSGHGVLMGNHKNEWQDTDAVLVRFGKRVSGARYRYRQFVEKGIALGQRSDLIGGGLVRSAGGWSAVKQLRRENTVAKGDERILGDGDFVEAVLAHATETRNRKHHLWNKDLDLETIIQRIGQLLDMTREEVLAAGKNRRTVRARSLMCYWAVEALGISMTQLSTRLDISVNAVSKSVARGRALAKMHDLSLI
jgi:REP element-mobilizing transposase RayT